jgi:hypothetical protein
MIGGASGDRRLGLTGGTMRERGNRPGTDTTVVSLPAPAQVVRVNRDALPDPAPFVTADLRVLIDRSSLSFGEIAAAINRTCRITWLDQYLVERWYEGKDFPTANHARVLLWLAGYEAASLLAGLVL